jgi:hypothetical protein
MELYQKKKTRKEKLRDANHKFLLKYNWEWFCSLNLQAGSDYPMAESKLKAWRINVAIHNHILIAYMGVFNRVPQPHIHLLLSSKRNRFGQTLLDLKPKSWEAAWSDLTKCQAVIEPIYEREGVASYIANKNLPWDKSELIQPYNKRLLVKAMLN